MIIWTYLGEDLCTALRSQRDRRRGKDTEGVCMSMLLFTDGLFAPAKLACRRASEGDQWQCLGVSDLMVLMLVVAECSDEKTSSCHAVVLV